MGLRALCCSRGDKGDDSPDPPTRPVQAPPEKNRQNSPPRIKQEPPLPAITLGELTPAESDQEKPSQPTPSPQAPSQRDLWKEAYDSLDPSQQKHLGSEGVPATAAINQVVDDTTAKYEQWQKGGLKIRRKDGNDINLRDCSERILNAALQASDVITKAVSFDPTGKASTAWMVISFGMSIVQNRLDRRDAIFAASGYLAETLSYYTLIDVNYRNQNVGSDNNLDEALLRVYTSILEFTVEVKKGRDENEAKRTFQSVMALTDQPLQTLKDAINSQSVMAEKWASLAANLGDRKQATEHLAKTDAVLVGMKNLATKALTAEEEAQLNWMSDAPYSDHQRALQKKRTGDTGLWLLDLPEYNNWKTTPGSLLWLPGISGCGKSVLCSTVIQDIQEDCSLDPSKFLGYWYFQFGVDATQSIDAMIRSLIRQLSRSPVAPEVTKIWKDHHLKGSQPDTNAVSDVLDDLLSHLTSDVYLVFDALDECPENEESKERALVLDFLEKLLERQGKEAQVHILVTSRPEQDIKERLDRFSKIDLEAHLAEDVKTFVNSCLAKRPLNRWGASIHQLICDELLNSKERRFRWAELQIMALERCRNEDQIRDTLRTIPQTLEETYRKVLDNIDSKDEELAREILMIICLSPVVFDAKTVADMVKLSIPDILVEICTTSFITLFDENVQLAHFSVQEFLIVLEEGGQHHPCQFSAASGHHYLTEKTVDILLGQTEALTRTTAESKTQFLYASKHWRTHMTAAGGFNQFSPEIQAKINRLFTEPIVYYNWIRAGESSNGDNEWSKLPSECQPPIHMASLMGQVDTVGILLAQGADPLQSYVASIGDWVLGDSLVMAAHAGHVDVLETLLDKGPPPNPISVVKILSEIGHTKLGKVKLASVLQKLWDLGLLRSQSPDAANEINEVLIKHTIGDMHSAVEIMDIFIDWHQSGSVLIPEGVFFLAASENKNVFELLLDRCEFHVPPTFREELEASNGFYSNSGLALLAIKRPNEFPVDQELFEMFAQNCSLEEMTSMMQLRKSDVRVTTDVLEAATGNENHVFPLLWSEREPDTVITELMIQNAVASEFHSREFLAFIKERMDPQMSFSQETMEELLSFSTDGVATLDMLLTLPSSSLSVSETLLEIILSHSASTDMLSLLASRGFEIPITEGLVSSAASNIYQAPETVQYLSRPHNKPLPVTETALIAAVENLKFGADVLEILLQNTPSSLLTDKVLEGACHNKDAMLALLDRRRHSLPMDSMLLRIADLPPSTPGSYYPPGTSSADVLRVLLEQGLVKVDKTVVETLAVKFQPLNVLLSWKPDSPITEKALIAGANDDRSMRVLLEARGSNSPVSENVLIAAAQSFVAHDVVNVINSRCGPIGVTENFLRACIKKGDPKMMIWIVGLASESLIAKFVSPETWQDVDLWDYKSRCLVLVYLFKKTVSSISTLQSLDLPFDLDQEARSRMKELLSQRAAELSELPATDLASQLLIEMCYNETIEKFWEDHRFAVTDRLIEATERNMVADKEQLKLFLEQKRG
ncbi:hypothetical protein N7452_011232 [Penicillium brevicompactum]|uniref:NACHT domain-containing protein n=1 Tax=Penicillium brevicompactum TaxID=5074 RepID=A0A9W9Q3M5_PENBR|nr:hypothetical protein N7452_011232 [Penicillium brevicompactum]